MAASLAAGRENISLNDLTRRALSEYIAHQARAGRAGVEGEFNVRFLTLHDGNDQGRLFEIPNA